MSDPVTPTKDFTMMRRTGLIGEYSIVTGAGRIRPEFTEDKLKQLRKYRAIEDYTIVNGHLERNQTEGGSK